MDIALLLASPDLRPKVIPIMGALCGINSEIMYSENN